MKILLVEDDANLLTDMKQQFEKNGFQVEAVFDGLLAQRMVDKTDFDCLILDVNIPGINGFQLCKDFRAKGIKTPILLLTAFADIDDKLEGFNAGADDYLTKPFFFQELLARVRSLLKRGEIKEEENSQIISDLVIDPNRKMVSRAGESIKLTPREFEILLLMAKAKGNPVSKKELIKHVWGTSVDVNTNTIEVFINLLRSKIDKGSDQKLIHTRPGFGYYLSTEG
ncbi:MAG TPA: response regulator transcription factor [Catalimonadaceae bacterium]|jgi:DNA-binding response OmpR family regulator|nr:response regulator transcription factor [Catalimonadaceae bacterium]